MRTAMFVAEDRDTKIAEEVPPCWSACAAELISSELVSTSINVTNAAASSVISAMSAEELSPRTQVVDVI